MGSAASLFLLTLFGSPPHAEPLMVEEEGLQGSSASSLLAALDRRDSVSTSVRASNNGLPLWLFMFVYIATALMQPTLTDLEIRYSGGAGHVGWPPTLLATLANALPCAFVLLLVLIPGGGASGLRRIFSERSGSACSCARGWISSRAAC